MNTPLRRVGVTLMALIVLLLANMTYIQVVKADDYRKDPRNQRVVLQEYARQRGQIVAADGTQLARVQETNDRLRFLRVYPNGPVYAPVTGYYTLIGAPVGMERAQDDVLNGSDDRLFVPRLSDLITGRDPRGGNVQLTIEPRVQQAAYDALTRRGFTGAVVAIRPKTGEILAMASTPSYDPNPLASHDTDVAKKAFAQLSGSDAQPMANRAISEIYPPGSTFKLVVSAAALESGQYNKDSQLVAAPRITLPGTNTTLENFNGTPCGGGATASFDLALTLSCNTAFADLAGQLGPDRLRDIAKKFGIGDNISIPLAVAPSTIGPLPDKAALFQSGIGQRDVKLTPLQDAVIAATIANGGRRMVPNMVKAILAPDLSVLDEMRPEEAERVMSEQNAATLRDMMVDAEGHAGGEGKIAGVTIASKTGTAEHGNDPKHTNPHAWYVAFAPANNPQIAVAVVVENGGDRGLDATGAKVAGPIGRAVIGAALGGG
ncbi:peptidoglycan D,D-transpeptidase FtsI family protein [Gandjariella thermophila]|uniref:Penicillin-binding protein A n=1 Tax=Gandjariella thermophila TaxID=1931992 RepID=A0A4D4J8H5_9PSEU|nr:penicillin-binding protein 2 [Gandjariella thermophila]GDY30958.1 penicillin-binding protein A [Gandjariella thermophila]